MMIRERINYLLLAVLILGQVIDIAFTKRALELGIEEANPLMRVMIDQFGPFGIDLIKWPFIVLIVVMLPFARSWIVTGLMALVSAAYVLLAIYHFNYAL